MDTFQVRSKGWPLIITGVINLITWGPTKRARRIVESRFKIRKSANHLEKLARPRKYKRQILVVMEYNKLKGTLMK